MHALVINVKIQPGHEEEGIQYLQTSVLPQMRQIPGLVAGYWLAAENEEGLTVLVFEDEQAARNTAKGLSNVPTADFASVGDVELRHVVAHIDAAEPAARSFDTTER